MGQKTEATRQFLTEHVLHVVNDYGKDVLKETIGESVKDQSLEFASTVGIDLLGSMIPAIGGAISAYRTERKLQNLNITLKEFAKKADIINKNLLDKTEENKAEIDKVFELLIEMASTTNQEDKIEYMVNGFVNVTKHEHVNFDITYLYYDTLERLSLLDIATLQLSDGITYASSNSNTTYQDILDEFHINYNQYQAVRDNLERMGLLENLYDEVVEKDFANSVEAINDLYKIVKSMQVALTNPKKRMIKVKNSSTLKAKARDRLKISKFGRDFNRHFIQFEDPI